MSEQSGPFMLYSCLMIDDVVLIMLLKLRVHRPMLTVAVMSVCRCFFISATMQQF